MRETWYVMEDGTSGDPREIAPGADGVLRHKDGRAVAYKPHGPRSRGVDPDEERAKAKPKVAASPPQPKPAVEAAPVAPKGRDMKAEETKRGYTTR